MSATARYNVTMSPADAFEYTRAALQASGVLIGAQSSPAHIEFSLRRKDIETGTMEAVMPGRAVIAPAGDGQSTVTLTIDPTTQFILYAVALGLAALVFGGFFFGNFGGLWFLLILAAEGYLFWSIFNKWPADALNGIRSRMQASSAVTGGAPVVQTGAPVFAPAPPQAAPPAAGAADIADQIRRLAELRDQGHLTQEEFDSKKAELLKRM